LLALQIIPEIIGVEMEREDETGEDRPVSSKPREKKLE